MLPGNGCFTATSASPFPSVPLASMERKSVSPTADHAPTPIPPVESGFDAAGTSFGKSPLQ